MKRAIIRRERSNKGNAKKTNEKKITAQAWAMPLICTGLSIVVSVITIFFSNRIESGKLVLEKYEKIAKLTTSITQSIDKDNQFNALIEYLALKTSIEGFGESEALKKQRYNIDGYISSLEDLITKYYYNRVIYLHKHRATDCDLDPTAINIISAFESIDETPVGKSFLHRIWTAEDRDHVQLQEYMSKYIKASRYYSDALLKIKNKETQQAIDLLSKCDSIYPKFLSATEIKELIKSHHQIDDTNIQNIKEKIENDFSYTGRNMDSYWLTPREAIKLVTK